MRRRTLFKAGTGSFIIVFFCYGNKDAFAIRMSWRGIITAIKFIIQIYRALIGVRKADRASFIIRLPRLFDIDADGLGRLIAGKASLSVRGHDLGACDKLGAFRAEGGCVLNGLRKIGQLQIAGRHPRYQAAQFVAGCVGDNPFGIGIIDKFAIDPFLADHLGGAGLRISNRIRMHLIDQSLLMLDAKLHQGLLAAICHDGCEIIRSRVDQHIESGQIHRFRKIGIIFIIRFLDFPKSFSCLLGDGNASFAEDGLDFRTQVALGSLCCAAPKGIGGCRTALRIRP